MTGESGPLFESTGAQPVLRANRLTKRYASVTRADTSTLEVFHDLEFALYPGELVSVVGESGSGKSSLLHLLAALDRPTEGEVWYGDQRLSRMSGNEAARFRNHTIGYVWQFHYLLPELTALENIALPVMASGVGRRQAMLKAERWLDEVGLAHRSGHRSGELSGGEQQRISLARALVTEPQIFLADEPTGDLDEVTAESIFALLQRLHASHGLASVLVTHNRQFAKRCDRMLLLHKGQLQPA